MGFLISDISRLLRKRFDERARRIGVTRAQWRTLTMLSRHEGATQGRLADLMEVEPITLCRMIDRLEEAGHVERRRTPTDRRAWNLFLTDRARPLLDQLRAMGDELLATMLAGLDEPARSALSASLLQIHDNLLPVFENESAHG